MRKSRRHSKQQAHEIRGPAAADLVAIQRPALTVSSGFWLMVWNTTQ